MDRGSSSISRSHGGLAGSSDEHGERRRLVLLCRRSGPALLQPPSGRRHQTERGAPPGQVEIPRRRPRDRVALDRDAGCPWRRAHAARVRSVVGPQPLRAPNSRRQRAVAMPDQPGSPYPNAASVDVRRIDGAERVFVAGGETVYAVDALSGREVWHFDAGTGCGVPPGDCGFGGSAPETNEVESSPIVAGDAVVFGMDINAN